MALRGKSPHTVGIHFLKRDGMAVCEACQRLKIAPVGA